MATASREHYPTENGAHKTGSVSGQLSSDSVTSMPPSRAAAML